MILTGVNGWGFFLLASYVLSALYSIVSVGRKKKVIYYGWLEAILNIIMLYVLVRALGIK